MATLQKMADMTETNTQGAVAKKPVENTWPVLAGMRFVFASLVIFYHLSTMIPTPHVFATLNLFVYAAVPGFFLISGYSIAHSVMQQPKGFYERRLTRIYPVYLAALVLACVPYLVHGALFYAGNFDVVPPTSVWSLIGNAFFLQGFTTHAIKMFGPSWTLAIEVFFYLLAPLLVRIPTRVLIPVILLSAFVYMHQESLHITLENHGSYGAGVLILGWNWLAGFVLYRHRDSELMRVFVVSLCGIALGSGIGSNSVYSVAAFCAAATLIGGVHKLELPGKVSSCLKKWGTYLGDLSYPLYLVHIPIFCLILGSDDINAAPRFAPVWIIAAAYAGAILMYHLVDAPYRAYAKRRRTPLGSYAAGSASTR